MTPKGLTVEELEQLVRQDIRDAVDVTDLLAVLPRTIARAIDANNRRLAASMAQPPDRKSA